jgi:hypothetical protein
MSNSIRSVFWLAVLVFALAIACSESDPTDPGDIDDIKKSEDRTPPQTIDDVDLTYPAPGGALLTWTAPADDDNVDRYEIRYSYSFPLIWDVSVPVADPPTPANAGESQQYEFPDPWRGRDLYAAIRSFDAAGNASLISPVANAHIDGYSLGGLCVDAMTREPVEGLEITVTERRVHTLSTGADGRYQLGDLTTGVVNVSIRSGTSGVAYHDHNQTFDLAADEQLEHTMIEYIPTEITSAGNVLRLFFQAVGMPTFNTFKKYRSYPLAVYAPPYVNDFGFDYEDYCKRAVIEWNQNTGLDVFEWVDTLEASTVTFWFRTPQEMGIHTGLTHHENDPDGYPLRNDIELVNTISDGEKLMTIALHELGHTIRIKHLTILGYLMYPGHPLPVTATNDEVKLVQLYLALPNGLDLTVYDDNAPE